MAKLILHNKANLDAIIERRLQENFSLSPKERMKKAYLLMAISAKLKNGALKEPKGLGVILKKRK